MIIKSLFLLALMIPGLDSASDTSSTYLSEQLKGSTVSARVADAATSPLRLADISAEQIRLSSAGHTYPELIKSTPGVYASPETGSFGDAKINIRGFKQENISVLLNGIPISGLTSGSMYWNNWMGLSDATASIQVQKGIGNSMLSDNSVGGTINIITTRPSNTLSAEISYNGTNYGTNGICLNVNSGNLGRGWSFNLMGSHNWGTTYVDFSNLSTWSYLASVSKRINAEHSLNFTALGSPETHNQRSSRLSYEDVDKHGIGFNKSWGWCTADDGSKYQRTIARNTYFKPYFTLSHSFTKDLGDNEHLNVETTLYGAGANGGGYYTESTGKRISSFVVPDGKDAAGQIDWDGVYAFNLSQEPTKHGIMAQNIMTDYLAGHTQLGAKSSALYTRGDRLSIDAGLHYQYYGTWEREQISDLLGADCWFEDYERNALCGTAGRNPIKKVGDFIRLDNGRYQHYATLYAIGTYTAGAKKGTVLTAGASASGTAIQRWDRYNYTAENAYSQWTGGAGGSVKAGVLQTLCRSTKMYLNAAAYTRVPYASVFFPNGNNSVARDVKNEKNYLGELGVRTVTSRLSLEATAYIAYWKDKSLLSSPYTPVEEDPYKYMISGLDALHYGGELNVSYRFCRYASAEAFASVGDWRWKNDVNATIYDPVTMQPIDKVEVYADGLPVGDAPQTQIGASLLITPYKGVKASLEWNWNDRMYADFDPISRTDPNDRSDPYRIPSWHMLNLALSWDYDIKWFGFTLFFNANNLLDSIYIERSKDGYTHDAATFSGYWGNRRNFTFGIRLRFSNK